MSSDTGGNGGLQLDVVEALATTKTVGQIVEEMGVVLTRLNQNAQDAQAMWQGSASKAFQDAASAWQAEGAQLKAALDGLKSSLATGFTGYESEDEDTAGTINSVMGSGTSVLNL